MQVFVTGATGYVGSGVCRALQREGHEVIGLTSKGEKAKKLEKLGIKPVVGDMRDSAVVSPVAAEADATIMCAQLNFGSRFTKSKLRLFSEAEILHVKAVVKGAELNKRTAIYTAGYLIFGVDENGWTNEKCGFDPPDFSKGGTEAGKFLLDNVSQGKVSGCVIASGFVYGPAGMFKDMTTMIKKGKLALPGGGKYYWSPVYIEDLASAYLLALDGRANGKAVLVVDDEPMLMKDIMYLVADSLKTKRPRNAPKFMASLFMGGSMVEGITTSRRCKNDLAKELLQWKPTFKTFKEGLPTVLEQLSD